MEFIIMPRKCKRNKTCAIITMLVVWIPKLLRPSPCNIEVLTDVDEQEVIT